MVQVSEYKVYVKNNMRDYLLDYMRNQNHPSRNTMYKYWRLLRGLGIHWCIIPTSYNIPHLESPIAILDRHITDIEENRESMARRFYITELEAELYGDIEVEEEETIPIPNEVLDELES